MLDEILQTYGKTYLLKSENRCSMVQIEWFESYRRTKVLLLFMISEWDRRGKITMSHVFLVSCSMVSPFLCICLPLVLIDRLGRQWNLFLFLFLDQTRAAVIIIIIFLVIFCWLLWAENMHAFQCAYGL